MSEPHAVQTSVSTVAAPAVVHLAAADLPPWRIAALDALAERGALFWIGPGALPASLADRAVRIATPLRHESLTAHSLAAALDRRPGPSPALFHAWSPAAVRACLSLIASGGTLLVEAEDPDGVAELARLRVASPPAGRMAFLCPSARVVQRLAQFGVPADDLALIRPFVNFAEVGPSLYADTRSKLLSDADAANPETRIVAVAPPVSRAGGAFVAAWAGMLLSVVRPGVRIILPSETVEARRILRLAAACRFTDRVRLAPRDVGWPALASAADVIVFVPSAEPSLVPLSWAMAAGRPIVASATPAITELLVHRENALLARPTPREITRRLLEALEDEALATRCGEVARGQAYQVFSRSRALRQVRQAYENLVQGGAVGDGIEDAAGTG